jgi:hypothetical protein
MPQAHYFLVATYLITFSCHATHLAGQEGTIEHTTRGKGRSF